MFRGTNVLNLVIRSLYFRLNAPEELSNAARSAGGDITKTGIAMLANQKRVITGSSAATTLVCLLVSVQASKK